jgi:hypothetical protein
MMQKLIMAVDKLKSETSASKSRDEKGHFINTPNLDEAKNPLERFLMSHTGNYKDQQDLLDIRVGNPLGRVVQLLEDIKKQKAFSFTLKGSLGVAGVVLVISVFGFFGGNQALCEKGRQTQIGTIKVLQAREIYTKSVPIITYLLELASPPQKLIKNRVVLVKDNQTTIYVPYTKDVDLTKYSNTTVAATGSYNSCSQTLTVTDPSEIEAY